MSDFRSRSLVLLTVAASAVGVARPQVVYADPQLGVEQIAARSSAVNEKRQAA